MRKKISSIILSLFILFACVFASACGDKYEDMEFKIYYSLNRETPEWKDGSGGILLNYMTEEDKSILTGKGVEIDESSLLCFVDGKASVFVKVEIENVKSKHIDRITLNALQSAGFDFRSATVGQGDIIEINRVKTALKFTSVFSVCTVD